MKILFFLTILCMVFGSCKNQASLEASNQPNIVLFFVDDMGWQDTSVPFWHKKTPLNERYHTPNMEKLASEGMMFTQAYATPVCSPTRISLMTGMNAARHRVTNWTLHKDALQPMETNHKALSFPAWNVNGMSPDPLDLAVHADALPSLLQKAGYYTIHAGKAHFGAIDTPAENPEAIGFDVNIAGHAAGGPGSYLGANNFSANWRGGSAVWDIPGLEKYHGQEIFLTEALTREAIIAMDKAQNEDKPFFMYMSHYAVHAPIEKDERYYQKYLDKGLDEKEASYAALIEGMDKSLGDIMQHLKEKNLMENTIILFMSDNGGLSVHSRGGEPHTHNKPLSSGKGSIHEGGIRVPMIVKWPGVTIPGSTNDNYLIIEDFYPSILEMAGVEDQPTVQKVDGKSFVGMLESNNSQKSNNRPLFWHYPNEWGPKGPGIGAFSAIRKGDFKLIYYHIDESFELFNIREDIGEESNLAATKPEKVKELAAILSAHLKEVEAQMPIHKESGKTVAYPGE
ncbi:sulfatase [Cyclobacterium marinum]|uniref:sulfatase n=1 Tax=Cyclobacterium marinum TaxID=104 RepID=UPI001F54A12F|nr:sulfatase [Cyclobacterium marinum]